MSYIEKYLKLYDDKSDFNKLISGLVKKYGEEIFEINGLGRV